MIVCVRATHPSIRPAPEATERRVPISTTLVRAPVGLWAHEAVRTTGPQVSTWFTLTVAIYVLCYVMLCYVICSLRSSSYCIVRGEPPTPIAT